MGKGLWFGVIVGGTGVVLQFLSGFTNPEAGFLGYLLFVLSVLWIILVVGLNTLPPDFGRCAGFGIFLAMCAGAYSSFLPFDTACLVWALAFTIWLVAEMATAYHYERKRHR